ncbi:MAG: HlyD family efflux transporter periplasmic adaptor subunit, partial [Bacillota bacterium]
LVGGQLADDAPTQPEVIQILSQLHSANLLEADVTPDAAVLLRRHKQMVKRQWQGRLMNILFPRIPLWDPDRFICRWMPLIKPFISPFGAILWLVVVGAAVIAMAPRWAELQRGFSDAIAPTNWLFLWASFWGIKLIHELGHGFSCRRFGGEVHELGMMFLVLVPCPYVDASSAWAFPNKWARVFVGAGGMVIELFVSAIVAFIWMSTAEGNIIHQWAFNTMFIASVSTLLFNANPLLRYDGYYMLSDFLEIPNLRYKSTEYTMGLIKRHLFRVKSPFPLPPVGQRIWLFLYSISSSIYRTIIGIFIIFMVYQQVPVLGVLMAIGGVVTWLAVPVVKTLKYLLIEPELHRKRTRATLWVVGFATAVLIVVGLIPFPQGMYTVGVLQPIEEKKIHAEVPGTVAKIEKQDGQFLKKGDVILVCEDREFDSQIAQLEMELKSYEASWNASLVQNSTEREVYRLQIVAARKQLGEMKQKKDLMTVRAPIDGVLVAPRIRDLQGRYVKPGEEIAAVADINKLRVTVVIDQSDAAQIFEAVKRAEKDKPQMRLEGQLSGNLPQDQSGSRYRYLYAPLFASANLLGDVEGRQPEYTWSLPSAALGFAGGGTFQTDPSDQNCQKLTMPLFQAWVELDNKDHRYVPGQRTYVRFTLKDEPLMYRWQRRLWQLIQSETRSKWM